MSPKDKIKILVAGQMRSGTTFVGNLLNTQNDFFVYSDMLVSLFDHITALDIKDLRAPLSDRQKNILFSNLHAEGLNRGIKFDSIDRNKITSWMHLYDESLGVLAKMKDTAVVGVKCTKADAAFSDLMRDGHKVIYCIRDPRDVLYSAQNRFAGVNQLAYLSKWKQGVNKILDQASDPNLYILKYEDFILYPEEQCKKLSAFIGRDVRHDITGDLIHGTQAGYTNNSSFGDVKELFDKKAAYRWKQGPVTDQTLFASSLLRSEIETLGYESLSTGIRAIDKLKWAVMLNSRDYAQKLSKSLKPILKKLFYK